jgi:ribulose-bisphosphate carboxylase large chain
LGQPGAELAATPRVGRAIGLDLVNDDHGLASQPFAAFEARVTACAAAVRETNEREGTHALYLPSLNVPADRLREAATFALEAGAGGLLVLPGLHGFDAVRALAEDDELALPIMGHPSLLGTFVTSPSSGIDHGVVFGTLMRLAGCDVSVFPNAGGRFSFSLEECLRIADRLRRDSELRPAVPAPAGGMRIERIEEMVVTYGVDVALLIGGELHRGDRRERSRAMRQAAQAAAGAAATAARGR